MLKKLSSGVSGLKNLASSRRYRLPPGYACLSKALSIDDPGPLLACPTYGWSLIIFSLLDGLPRQRKDHATKPLTKVLSDPYRQLIHVHLKSLNKNHQT